MRQDKYAYSTVFGDVFERLYPLNLLPRFVRHSNRRDLEAAVRRYGLVVE